MTGQSSKHWWEGGEYRPERHVATVILLRFKTLRKLTLSVRKDQCELCGFAAGRDVNAALNILQRGLGKSLNPGRNISIRRENGNSGAAFGGPTTERCALGRQVY